MINLEKRDFAAPSWRVQAAILLAPWMLWGIFYLTDTWQKGFTETGAAVIADTFARLAALAMLIESCRGYGRLVGVRKDGVDGSLLAIAAGFALSNVVGGLIGYVGILSPILACLFFGIGLVAAVRGRPFYFNLRSLRQCSPAEQLAAAVAVLAAVFFALARAIPVDVTSNDFAHYLPYYAWVKAGGTTFPSYFFIDTFYLKGAGLNHLVVSISDPVGAQLSGAIAILLISAVAGRLATLVAWNSSLLGFLTVTFAILNGDYWGVVELEKAHALTSAMLMALVLLLTIDASRGLDRYEKRAAMVIAASAPSILPSASPFLLSLCALFLVTGLHHRNLSRGAFPLVAAITSVAATLAFAYARSGLLEFSPLRIMLALRDDDLMRRWIDPAAMLWFEAYNDWVFEIRLDPLGLLANAKLICCVGVLVASTIAFLSLRGDQHRVVAGALGLLMASFLSLTILLTVQHVLPGQSIDLTRFSVFLPALLFVIPAAIAKVILGEKPDLWHTGIAIQWLHPGQAFGVSAALAMFVISSGPATWYVSGGNRAIAMVFGNQSRLAQIEKSYPAPECLETTRLLPPNSRVLVMGLMPGCYVLPQTAFFRLDMSPVNIAYSDALFGDPAIAKKAYDQQGIEYFLVASGDLYYAGIPAPQIFAPLFRPHNIAAHFRIMGRVGENAWLLTTTGAGTPIEQSFVDRYRELLALQANTASGRAYAKLARLSVSKNYPSQHDHQTKQ